MRPSVIFTAGLLAGVIAFGQALEPATIPLGHPAIRYQGETQDPVAGLNRTLQRGSIKLNFDRIFGYLPSLSKVLGVPVESQVMVFSKTSLQSILISPANPRAIYFSDSVAIAWVRGSPTLEVAAQDPRQGTVFYTLDQSEQTKPVLAREDVCIGCHDTPSTLGVPGMIVRTVFPKDTGAIVTGLIGAEADHRTPFEERWGGWYVTGRAGPPFHRANAVVGSVNDGDDRRLSTRQPREPLPEKFSTTGYPTPYSDIVALTILEHQVHLSSLITRIGWDARTGATETLLTKDAKELVDYLLFVDEAPLPARIEGSAGFASKFSGVGPFDSKGRSLREFNLQTRLMKYPCSYMIYADAFRFLPEASKNAIYQRMWRILSGLEKEGKYSRLSLADRRAVVEILRETVRNLPEFFSGEVR